MSERDFIIRRLENVARMEFHPLYAEAQIKVATYVARDAAAYIQRQRGQDANGSDDPQQ